MNRHIWKIIMPILFIWGVNDLIGEYTQNDALIIFISIILGFWGFICGVIIDIKRGRRLDIKEFNKNVRDLKNVYANSNKDTKLNNAKSLEIIDKLDKLYKLKENKSITEEEFLKLKENLINDLNLINS